MGSKSSSSSNSGLNQGKFQYYYNCKCSGDDLAKNPVRKIKWHSVHIMSTGSRVGANIGRGFLDVFTLGLAEIGFQGKQLSHDVILAELYCNKCSTTFYYTLEKTDDGTQMREGKYTNVFDNAYTYYPSNMNFSNLKSIYNFYSESGDNYSLVWKNCKHWAKEVYNEIKRSY